MWVLLAHGAVLLSPFVCPYVILGHPGVLSLGSIFQDNVMLLSCMRCNKAVIALVEHLCFIVDEPDACRLSIPLKGICLPNT